MRTLAELTSTDDPAWPSVQGWLKEAKAVCEVLESCELNRTNAIVATQVTHSTLGAIIYETGGILIDRNWLRLLGSGHEKLNRSVSKWNLGKSFKTTGERPSFLLVADDAAGCFYAINGGAFGNDQGNMYWFPSDTMQWQAMGFGYTDFVHWVITCDLAQFYEGLRWPSWQEDVSKMSNDEAMTFFPPLCFDGPPLAERERKPLAIERIYRLHVDRA